MDSIELAEHNRIEKQQKDYKRYQVIRDLKYAFQMIDEMKIQLIDQVSSHIHTDYGGTVDYDCPSLGQGLVDKSIKLMKMWEILNNCKLVNSITSTINKTNSNMEQRQEIFNKMNEHYKYNWADWGSIKNRKSLNTFRDEEIKFENDNERKS
tara:strand:+ start:488 stop:943 length:456 start_codon:yes stop_codon:yes gene_type:complete